MTSVTSYSFRFELDAGAERVFELFSDPRRLNDLTPRWFDLRPREPLDLPVNVGTEIAYRFRWRGLPLPWRSRIVEYRPPSQLTYEQVRGPYRYFRHEHLFEPTRTGTLAVDRVQYRSGLGAWWDRGFVKRDLDRIFRVRAARAAQLLAADPDPALSGRDRALVRTG